MISFQLYIAEIACPSLRGCLSTVNQLFLTFGILLAFGVGPKLTWQMTALIACVPITLLVISMVFMPETPRWLLANGLRQKALMELAWLRGPDVDVEEECREIESNLGKC